jgi:hypothetical protein
VDDVFEKVFGSAGPPHLVALIPDDGIAEPGWVTWTAIPSWDHHYEVADAVNAEAPEGWHARIANWDLAMPNALLLHVSDLCTAGSHNGSVQLGVAVGSAWKTWELAFEQPPVPDISNDQIWKTP